MHSGFLAVREDLPQNIRMRWVGSLAVLSTPCRVQVARILEIWSACCQAQRDQGPWLFGAFSLAEVMYAPVALRFVTYSIPVPGPAGEFIAAVQALPAIREWCETAALERESLEFIDRLAPAAEAPLTLG